MPSKDRRWPVISALGVVEILAWGSSFYLPAVLAGPIAESMGDDDQYCQAGGKVAVGTPEYVACRKDRDVQRQNAEARTDRRQRDLGEYMMNNPDRH